MYTLQLPGCKSGCSNVGKAMAEAKNEIFGLLPTLGMSAGAAIIAEATTLPFDTAKVDLRQGKTK